MERVVVTGMGVVSCVGSGLNAFWSALTEGRSGIDRITAYDPAPYRTQIAGEVRDFKYHPKESKRLARYSQLAMGAADEAMAMAGLPDGLADPTRAGVSVGTGIAGLPFLMQQYERFLAGNPGRVHPLTIPIIIPNMGAANISMKYGLEGPSLALALACTTGNHSIGSALDLLRCGRADVMVAGGAEAIMHPYAVLGFINLKALSRRNDDPPGASRPFSLSRDGFVPAEGAAVVVLETLSHARKRGADILAEIAGFGMSTDAYHLTAPSEDGRGAAAAMTLALDDAKVSVEDVDCINAHGTSTQLNDLMETRAIEAVFGDHAGQLAVHSIKSMIGHSLGAASAIEAVAAVQTLRSGVIPPTINLSDPDPELTLDYVPHTARETTVNTVLSNSFAFGGHNGCLVIRSVDAG